MSIASDRDRLAGTTLTVSDGMATKVFTFPATPHNPLPPRLEYVLIISQALSQVTSGPSLVVGQWDYVMPDGFLPEQMFLSDWPRWRSTETNEPAK